MKSKKERTYYCILCEMSGFSYNASKAEKSLVKEVREYLLSVLNGAKGGKFYDPIFACSVMTFYGHHLSWNKTSWKKSAEIVYQYFKASTLIKKIKSYELVFNKPIISDYLGALNYLVECLSKETEIDYWKIPGICASFELVPQSLLDKTIIKFQELYE